MRITKRGQAALPSLRPLSDPAERARRQQLVAEHISRFQSLSEAARLAGVSYSTVRAWRQNDDTFRALLEDAEEQRTQLLEREAWRRAFTGSDRLLEFMLRAARPAVYRENKSIDVNVHGSIAELGDVQRAARILALIAAADAPVADGEIVEGEIVERSSDAAALEAQGDAPALEAPLV